MESMNQVHILDEAVWVLLSVNALGKDMYLFLLPQQWVYYKSELGFVFSFG